MEGVWAQLQAHMYDLAHTLCPGVGQKPLLMDFCSVSVSCPTNFLGLLLHGNRAASALHLGQKRVSTHGILKHLRMFVSACV